MVRLLSILLALPVLASSAVNIHYPIGETLSYRVYWGFLPVGRSTVRCESILQDGIPLIRIRVEAESNRLVSTLYPVQDRVESYIDRKSGLPLWIEKQTLEGGYECNDTLRFDRDGLMAHWESRSASITTNYPIQLDTLDVAAFLYALRSCRLSPDHPESFQIAVDGILHPITIRAEEEKRIKIASEKISTACTRYSVTPMRPDLFVRKIPDDIWVSNDERRVLVKMTVRTPAGKARIVLDRIENASADQLACTQP